MEQGKTNDRLRVNRVLFILFLVYAAVLPLSARKIDRLYAETIAERFLGKPVNDNNGSKHMPGTSEAWQPLYIFNAVDGTGFVVVAGDDSTSEILAYSDTDVLDMNVAPANLKWILDSYANAVAACDTPSLSVLKSKTQEVKPEIKPLLYSQWGQDAPYNLLCPLINGERSLTGCVATALAQIVNYHRWPLESTSSVSGYVTLSHGISMPELPATRFIWDNMTNDEIARLMLYCGQSVEMDYGVTASGAIEAASAEALKTVFGFSSATSYVYRESYEEEEWENIIYNELEQSHPVFYSGTSAEGGHAFVVDGCSDGKFHVDWGWNGYCNGYFTLTGLNGFNSGQGALINACPPGLGNAERPAIAVTSMICVERNLDRKSNGYFDSFNVSCNIVADLVEASMVDYAVALFSVNGIIKVSDVTKREFQLGEECQYDSTVALGNISNGDYRLALVCRQRDCDEWKQATGATLNYISVKVEGDEMKLMPMPMSDKDKNYIDYGFHLIDGIRYHLCSEYLNNRAYVDVLYGYECFKGDVFIPDYVMYQNIKFNVFDTCNDQEAWNLGYYGFPGLKSISFGNCKIKCIEDCPELESIEIREGCQIAPKIQNCPRLESLVYPTSITEIGVLQKCESVKTITVKSERPVGFIGQNSNMWVPSKMPSLTDVYFYSDKPYTNLSEKYFPDLSPLFKPNPNVKLHIPKNSLLAYSNSVWKEWSFLEDLPEKPVLVEYDYCGDNVSSSYGLAMGSGSNDVEAAMRIPCECLEAYKNCIITAIEFHTSSEAVNDNHWSDVEYVFVTTPGKDYIVKQEANTVRGTWTRVQLEQPYVITGDDLFVGMGRHSILSVDWANDSRVDDGFWTRTMGNDPLAGESGVWKKNAGDKMAGHPIRIRAIIEGQSLPMDIAMMDLGNVDDEMYEEVSANNIRQRTTISSEKDEALSSGYFSCHFDSIGALSPVETIIPARKVNNVTNHNKIRVKLCNRSPKNVSRIELGIDVDGKELESFVYEEGLMRNYETTLDVVLPQLPQNIVGRNHDVEIYVKSIDGEKDMIPANSSIWRNYITKTGLTYPRRIVLEEATATWCGYCPRGMVEIEKLKNMYPDNFITLAIHSGDEMSVSAKYEPFFHKISSLPSYIFNRQDIIEPLDFDIGNLLYSAEASVNSTASFKAGSNNNTIDVNSSVEFGFDDEGDGYYRLAYLIVEDNVGPYIQSNYYSDPSAPNDPDDNLNWWKHQGSGVKIMFDDIVRDVYDDYYGVANSIPSEIRQGKEYYFSHSIPVSDKVENVENIRLVTLLLDSKTGEILNACSSVISGYEPPILCESVSIEDVPEESFSVGDKFQLRATVKPDNATDKSVIWTSDNSDVASVNSYYGIIKGIAPGVANITATAADGSGVSCCVKVYVSPKFICVESISIEGVPESAIHEGDKFQLYAIVNPENATDKSVVWTSDSSRVISVDSDGLIIAVGLGVADIMAIAADGSGVYSSVTLCVSSVFVESIQILGLPEGVIEVGDKFRLQAVVYPDNATDKSVRWSSTAPEVAVVDDEGNVEITGIGSAGIVATAQDGGACQAVVYIDTVAGVVDTSADAGPFKVFDIHGRLIRTSDSPDTLKPLPQGVYIVRTPTQTYKITH